MTRCLIRPVMIAVCAATLVPNGVCQQIAAKPAPEARADHQVFSRVPADRLAELSGSLQRLASKVSPAVVQIEVSRFGLSEEGERKNTTLIVRQHAIGTGVIVDPDGYIMTNAHVIEGAQRIRVVIPAPPAALFDVSSAGKTQVLDAKLIGLQKEADLALLKVDANNLPTLRFNLERDPQPGELVFAIGSRITSQHVGNTDGRAARCCIQVILQHGHGKDVVVRCAVKGEGPVDRGITS